MRITSVFLKSAVFMLLMSALSAFAQPESSSSGVAGRSDWQRVSAAEIGWNQAAIDNALDFAGDHASSSVVILHDGKILAERNWDFWHQDHSEALPKLMEIHQLLFNTMYLGDTDDGRAIEDVASAQKSVISVLVGIAIDQGLVALDDPVNRYIEPGWSARPVAEENEITIRHLLTMSSGIGWKFEARKALGNFYYATPPYGRLHLVLEAAAGTDLETFSRQWLTGPLDMNETKWILRPEVYRSSNKYGLSSTALDLARFGQMILQEGQWNGKQIVSRAYLKKMLSPSQEDAAFFGYLWWLNGHPISMAMLTSEYTANSLADHAPEDMVAAMGACDRRIYVVPSLKLVVVRLGFYPELGKPSSEFDRSFLEENFWRLLMKAVPNDHHQ